VQNNYAFNIVSLYQKYQCRRLIRTDFKVEPEDQYSNPEFSALAHVFGTGGPQVGLPEDPKPALKKAIEAGRHYVLCDWDSETPPSWVWLLCDK
jgi:thiamine pyrophosphate-dependent acetolactate synthase large subunit-like protein